MLVEYAVSVGRGADGVEMKVDNGGGQAWFYPRHAIVGEGSAGYVLNPGEGREVKEVRDEEQWELSVDK